MSLQSLAVWLRCPNCFLPLSPGGVRVLNCSNGHAFDVNRRGFVNLLTGSPKFIGDSAEMLEARELFLKAGWFEPVRNSLTALVASENAHRVLDAGCGTGYYLQAAIPVGDDVRALGMDISPSAVLRTIRAQSRIDGLVANVWSPLPIRDGVVDVMMNVFAPRNGSEFHRILRPGGLLLVVVPGVMHLQQLRAAGLAVQLQPNKAGLLVESLTPQFTLESHAQVDRTVVLSHTEVLSLLGMGPSAHHSLEIARNPVTENRDVTFAFEIFSFRRNGIVSESAKST